MKQKSLYILLILIFSESCCLFNKVGDNFVRGIMSSFPDGCDLDLFFQLVKFHSDSGTLPSNSDIPFLISSLDTICRKNYDSIQLVPYHRDSIDISVAKSIHDTAGLTTIIFNKYRIKFPYDTASEINIIEGYAVSNDEDGPKIISRWENETFIKKENK